MSAAQSNQAAGTAPAGDAPAAGALHPVASTVEPAKIQPKGVKKDKPAKKVKDAGDGPKRPLELDPKPAYFDTRIEQFVAIQEEMKKFVAAQPREPIEITLPDGTKKEGTSWETSPMSIAQGISKSLSKRVMISKVDGQLWDLERPLEKSCSLELLDFEHPEGKRVFWHSSAHVLGEAAERHYGCHLCLGPPTEDGFFYEMGMTDERVVMSTDYDALTTLAKMAVKEKQPFERIVATKEQLLQMFQYNKYKLHMINTKVPDGSSTTVYRCGPMIDLCVGPHIPNTSLIGDFAIMKNSASYFLGDIKNDSLQRIYGVSFPDKEQMKKYQAFLAEAAKRDHRRIGKDQELFFFHELSPGSCFWLPHGTRIYNTLVDFVKGEYRKRGYSEVISPNMYNAKLWQTSGHWDKYADGMFQLKIEDEQFGLKPMNCPGHCLIFGNRDRSYRELPIRMADFGVLHRNEASGALSGLTRVRRFQQDDAHHFCMPNQIKEEIAGIFDLLNYVYGLLGFTYKLVLSTRPEKYLGEIETWDHAEKMLAEALDTFVPGEWVENPQDGAFYGPKIDITISDALGRRFQCATIQLDFQLPQRFNLRYVPATEDDWLHEKDPETGELKREKPRPVMIHRAIMGSVERFTAILTEHFGGKWPFWLSPRQAIVVPIAEAHKQYAISVQQKLWDAGLYADVELTDSTIQKKVRNAEIAQYNFILVVGAEEMSHNTVNVRNRDDPETKNKGVDQPVDEVVQKLVALKASKQLENKI